jgi:hypothetical protein
MKTKIGAILGLALILALGALVSTNKPGDYHLREFEHIKTNFNNYRPSIYDRLKGISNNKAKWDYHLRKLEELGAVEHRTLVFTNVFYTVESSRRIWGAACSNFPGAVMFSARHYATNDADYGVRPYVLEVWDFSTNMHRWCSFFETSNR